ncbi:hypothetical protein L7F22_051822 [Adiantum nelumboides]|nr:hypothetical protein [Adiantum nelumboides]
MAMALDLAPYITGIVHEEEEATDEEVSETLGSWPWQNFPSDLLFNAILVRLSFSRLLRLRSVSRSWRSCLSSSVFWFVWFRHNMIRSHDTLKAKRCSLAQESLDSNPREDYHHYPQEFESVMVNSNVSTSAWLYANRPVPCLLISSPSQSVGSLRFNVSRPVVKADPEFVRSSCDWFYLHEDFLQVQDQPFTILASEKGLMLLWLHSQESPQLLVCNPLLRTRKLLPTPLLPLTTHINSAAGFFVDAENGDYIIILCDCQAYHSTTGKWQVIPQSSLHVEDETSLPLALLDGSIFWLRKAELPRDSDYLLAAYHPRAGLVTCTHTQFQSDVFVPKRRHIWKDSQDLQTLVIDDEGLGLWKLDDGLMWRKLKDMRSVQYSSMLSYVKVGNLLIVDTDGVAPFYIFNTETDKGAWTPTCRILSCDCPHLFQPSYFNV